MASILNPGNRLFTLACRGRRPPSALAAIAVVFVMLALALIPGQMLARIVLVSLGGVSRVPSGIQSFAQPIVNVTMFLPIYLGLWVWLRLVSKRPFWTLGLDLSASALPATDVYVRAEDFKTASEILTTAPTSSGGSGPTVGAFCRYPRVFLWRFD